MGAGSWGTALGIALAPRFEQSGYGRGTANGLAKIEELRENRVIWRGSVCLNASMSQTIWARRLRRGCRDQRVPSRYLRGVNGGGRPHIRPGTPVVSATKGSRKNVVPHVAGCGASGRARVAVMSGPTFAKEIAPGSRRRW